MACKGEDISFNWNRTNYHMTHFCWRYGSVVNEFNDPYFDGKEKTLTLKYTTGLAYFLYALLFTPNSATSSTRGGDEATSGSKRNNDDDGGGGGGAKRSKNSGLSFTDLAI